jgi:putative thiamine transport system substrate-binding protein
MRRLRDFSLCLCLLLLWPLAVNADDSWRQIQTEARGQTVWFNAWGGDPAVNRYLAWVSEEVKRHYAIDLRIVPIADAADAVKRIQTEAQAGRRRGGSVDLLWINGENFRTLKQANLLLTGWAESLPNWRYVDLQKPVREDFSVATEGAESPWGSAQLTFIARRGQTPQPPTSPQALLAFESSANLPPSLLTHRPQPPCASRRRRRPSRRSPPRCGAISMRCTRPCGGRARISRRRRRGWTPCSTRAPSACR